MADWVSVRDAEGESDGVGVIDGVWEGLKEGVTLKLGEAVGLWEGLGEAVGVWLLVRVRLGLELGVKVGLCEELGLKLKVPVAV